jgi:phosphoribosylanthranilate isomerase
MVQLHGEIAPAELHRLRVLVPRLWIIKSLIVRGDNSEALVDDVGRFAPVVDSFITDTFDPLSGARGATGKTHDWRVSRRLVEASLKPVIQFARGGAGGTSGRSRRAYGYQGP